MTTPGQPFGRYTLHERLGAGGMAEVWRGSLTHGGVEKRLVIKRILRGLSADPAFLAMFVDEARIASLLHHPNIVQLYDLGEVDGEWYLAMEHVPGLNLNRALHSLSSRRRRLAPEVVAYIGVEVARGLDAAHRLVDHDGRALNVVHRDICPANLLLSTQGDVKIVDFGVARSAANTYTTQGAGLKGHVAYMSPEQALGARLDGRSDLFALGVVLWEALAGQRLFKADTGLQTLERVRDADVPPLPEGAAPPELEAVVRRALAREPEDRFADARAMQLALTPLVGAPEQRRDELAAVVAEVLAAERAEHTTRLTPLPGNIGEADEDAPTTVAATPPPPRVEAPPPELVVAPPAPAARPPTPAEPPRRRALWLLVPALIVLGMLLWPDQGAPPEPPEPPVVGTPAPSAEATTPVEVAPAPPPEPAVAAQPPAEVTPSAPAGAIPPAPPSAPTAASPKTPT
ncbi:serine/threonine protein kinase, partial [Myxococcota bacterium]|nr:serine/threonine protein kinase [Myxococcota bacterium]